MKSRTTLLEHFCNRTVTLGQQYIERKSRHLFVSAVYIEIHILMILQSSSEQLTMFPIKVNRVEVNYMAPNAMYEDHPQSGRPLFT